MTLNVMMVIRKLIKFNFFEDVEPAESANITGNSKRKQMYLETDQKAPDKKEQKQIQKEINIKKIKKVVNNKYQIVRDYSNLSVENPLYKIITNLLVLLWRDQDKKQKELMAKESLMQKQLPTMKNKSREISDDVGVLQKKQQQEKLQTEQSKHVRSQKQRNSHFNEEQQQQFSIFGSILKKELIKTQDRPTHEINA